MPLLPDEPTVRLRQIAVAVLEHWSETAVGAGAPGQVREAVVEVRDATDRDEETIRRALQHFIEAAPPSITHDNPWAVEPLGVLLRGLYSVGRQFNHSPAAKEVLRLCDNVRWAAGKSGAVGQLNELRSALMVIEDATCALEGYTVAPAFAHVDEAYLAKYGLLQALQVGFDGAEAVGRAVGLRLRADSVPGGKTVKITRNIVAGHPIRGNMEGQSWHHFHDRSGAQENEVIRVMSFSREDPDHWTGQTLLTDELIADGLDVIAELLRQAASHLAN